MRLLKMGLVAALCVCAGTLALAMAVSGTVLIFSSFFFERLSDWPRNLSMFAVGVVILSALIVGLRAAANKLLTGHWLVRR